MVNAQLSGNCKRRLLFLVGLALFFLASGLVRQDLAQLWPNLLTIWTSPSVLTTDYIALAGPGATLWNIALVLILEILILWKNKIEIKGSIIAAVFLTMGFSFFGTNILNYLPILAGNWLYAKLSKTPFGQIFPRAFYTSALGPMVSLVAFDLVAPLLPALVLAGLVGLLIGLVAQPLAESFHAFTRGYSLHHMGFVMGVIGTILVSFLRFFNVHVLDPSLMKHIEPPIPNFFIVFMTGLLIYASLLDKLSWSKFFLLLREKNHKSGDYDLQYGSGAMCLNMAFMGYLCLTYVYLTGSELTGPVLGAIMAAVGFAASGMHMVNTLPIMLGVYAMYWLSGQDPASQGATVAALFSAALAPISQEYGMVPGFIAGSIHAALVANIGSVHGGVNLYNNGFSTGFIAASLSSLLDNWRKIKGQGRINS